MAGKPEHVNAVLARVLLKLLKNAPPRVVEKLKNKLPPQ